MNKKRLILIEALRCKDLKALDKRSFLKAWRAVFFLYPGLHPDGCNNSTGGWPKRLKPLAREAFRRYEAYEITDSEMYPYMEVFKGLEARLAARKNPLCRPEKQTGTTDNIKVISKDFD